MSLITDWTPQKGAAFGKANLAFKHGLHERPMFSDAGLEELLDRYPREKLGVFTMGEDPVAWTTWRKGAANGLSGSKLLEAAQAGRIWLNLRQTNDHLPEYARLGDEIFAIVSRGGRPDLAGNHDLEKVKSPTLLLVGSRDQEVIELNQNAYAHIQCRKDLTIVPGATHLFEEAGTLEEVARHATGWFLQQLVAQRLSGASKCQPLHHHPPAGTIDKTAQLPESTQALEDTPVRPPSA